jgi:site-specific recombinase XerD
MKKKLPQSAIDFLEYLRVIKNRSEETIEGYNVDLQLFFDFITTYKRKSKINNNFIKGITLTDLYKFLGECEKRGNKAPTRARKVATLKSYFKYIHKKAKITKENVAEELETPKIKHKQPAVLNVDESIVLLNSIDKGGLNYQRDFCILTLFLHCGMRLSELRNIKLNDIKDGVLTIIGKGEKERRIYLNKTCLFAIGQYLNVRDDSKCSIKDSEYLFLSTHNRHIDKSSIQLLVKKHLDEAGMDINKLHTHSMRASFATMNYKHGADIATLARAMGHASINTTKIYINIDENDLRRLSDNNPLTCI